MSASHGEVFLHYVWTTLDRHPFLVGELREAILDCIQTECVKLKAEVLALNCMEEHVHLLVRMPSTLTYSALAKQFKGSSSHLARQVLGHGEFQWRESYSTFSISRWDVAKLTNYVRNQQEHHRLNTVKSVLEPTD